MIHDHNQAHHTLDNVVSGKVNVLAFDSIWSKKSSKHGSIFASSSIFRVADDGGNSRTLSVVWSIALHITSLNCLEV